MPSPAANWPSLSTGSGDQSKTIKETAWILEHDAAKLLQHIETHKPRVASPLIDFLRASQALMTRVAQEESSTRLASKFSNALQDIHREVIALKIQSTEQAKAPPRPQTAQVQSWARVAASQAGPPPSLRTSNVSSTPGAHVTELSQANEVIIKVSSGPEIEALRTKTPMLLRKQVNYVLAKVSRKEGSDTLASVQVMAAKQLKSGDVSIRTRTAREAEILGKYKKLWITTLGSSAEIRRRTYGVVLHGIPLKSVGDLKDEANVRKIISGILMDNAHQWPKNADIALVKWLTRSQTGKKASSLILEFTQAEAANAAIYQGIFWSAEYYRAEFYNRGARFKQCHNCQAYGHIGTQCPNLTKCAYCAENHSSKDCPDKAKKVCANCQNNHTAYSPACDFYKREAERIAISKKNQPLYHPEICHLSKSDISPNQRAPSAATQSSRHLTVPTTSTTTRRTESRNTEPSTTETSQDRSISRHRKDINAPLAPTKIQKPKRSAPTGTEGARGRSKSRRRAPEEPELLLAEDQTTSTRSSTRTKTLSLKAKEAIENTEQPLTAKPKTTVLNQAHSATTGAATNLTIDVTSDEEL